MNSQPRQYSKSSWHWLFRLLAAELPALPSETVLDSSNSGAWGGDTKSRICKYPKKSEWRRLKGRKELLAWRR